MNSFFKSFHTSAHDIRLTHAERRHIHAHVIEAIRASENAVPTYAYFSFFTRPMAAVFALILIVGISGGTAYAAEGSLPGDLLYPVKVSVTEPLRVALAATPAAKASVNADIASERLAEAQTLAADGTLTATTSEELAINFNAHADAAYAAADVLSKDDPASASEISANLSDAIAQKGGAILSAGAKTKNLIAMRASSDFVVHASGRVASDTADISDTSSVEPQASSAVAFSAPMMRASTVPAATTTNARRAHEALFSLNATLANSGSSTSTLAARSHAAELANLIVKADAEASLGSTTEADTDYSAALTNAVAIQDSLSADTSSENDTQGSVNVTVPTQSLP